MLKPLKNNQAFSKIGIYGTAGSGKTRTACEIAIGLHRHIGSKKPIAVFDTEPAFGWVLPLFEKAGIEILVSDESRALADLMTFMSEAEKAADIVIIDSITHVWRDAQDSYLAQINKSRKGQNKKPIFALEFHHWRPIKEAWARFTDKYMSSKMHVVMCGRAGQIYEYQDKDDGTGKKELITTGSKMATEKELGYENSMLIEMVAERRENRIVNIALIEKDRADRLNGSKIEMPNFQKLKSHFECLNIGGEHFKSMDERDSASLFPDAEEPGWDMEKKQREIWCEEIQGLLLRYYPGQTAVEKKAKSEAIEKVFGTRSWTKVEMMRSDALHKGFIEMENYLCSIGSNQDLKENI